MELFRLGNCKFFNNLSGDGARLYGGRWNSVGVSAVYFATTRALALLEVLVHLPPNLLPDNFCMSVFNVEAPLEEIKRDNLPTDWNVFPFPKNIQMIGDEFLKDEKNFLLKVPSAIIDGEFNIIMNPKHFKAKEMLFKNTSPFSFDGKLR
jgi:RES domain-containing protein